MRVPTPVQRIGRRWGTLTPRQRSARLAIAVTAVLAVTAGVLTAVLLSGGEPPRARQYLAFKACLLTDAEGVTGQKAAPVWAGMQQASLKTRAKVQYLAITGPATVPNAGPFIGSLVGLRCDLVIAPDGLPATAVLANAPAHPDTRFIVIGQTGDGPNITAVTASDVPAQVERLVTTAVKNADG